MPLKSGPWADQGMEDGKAAEIPQTSFLDGQELVPMSHKGKNLSQRSLVRSRYLGFERWPSWVVLVCRGHKHMDAGVCSFGLPRLPWFFFVVAEKGTAQASHGRSLGIPKSIARASGSPCLDLCAGRGAARVRRPQTGMPCDRRKLPCCHALNSLSTLPSELWTSSCPFHPTTRTTSRQPPPMCHATHEVRPGALA